MTVFSATGKEIFNVHGFFVRSEGATHEHVFDNDSDKECNVEGCDFVRAIGAELREEDGVKYYYYDGIVK